MKQVYTLEATGEATNLHNVKDDYVLQGSEQFTIEVEISKLHSPVFNSAMVAIRAERDRLLKIADIEINILEDAGLTPTSKRTYRQALRDVPTNFPDADMATFDWTTI